jgi:hypothetical protein
MEGLRRATNGSISGSTKKTAVLMTFRWLLFFGASKFRVIKKRAIAQEGW